MLAGFANSRRPAKHKSVVHLSRGTNGQIRGSYDSAQTTDHNKRHWARADQLSANAAASPTVRATIRKRARYEVANNTFARGIVNTLADWTIGSGPSIQIAGDSRDAVTRIEARFNVWATAIALGQKLWTMRVAQAVDGEAVGRLISNPALAAEVKLDLRLVECDQLSTPNFSAWNAGPNTTDGIVFDEYGNPVEYHFLKNHPGNNYGGSSAEYERVPAEHVIHLFRVDRPGQHRGVSELQPALGIFADLRRYSMAVLGSAESAADWAIVLETPGPSNEEAEEEVAQLSEVELTPRMMTMAPYGTEAKQIKPEQPATTYHEYFRDKINEAARCVNMPLNIALGNSQDFNYASGRLDHQTFFRSIRVEQTSCFERQALNLRVVPSWMYEDRLLHPADYSAAGNIKAGWNWPGREHVDPAKEATAQDKRLKNGSTNQAIEYAREGRDWETELRQSYVERQLDLELQITLAKERKKLLKAAKLTEADLAPPAPAPAAGDDAADDDDDDEKQEKQSDDD